MGQDLGVSRIRGLAAEDQGGEARATEDLVHQRELQLAVAGATELRPEMTGPEAPLLHLLLERRQYLLGTGIRHVEGVTEDEIERLDLLTHELVHPVQLTLELGLRVEIPGDCRSSLELSNLFILSQAARAD